MNRTCVRFTFYGFDGTKTCRWFSLVAVAKAGLLHPHGVYNLGKSGWHSVAMDWKKP